jgi:spore germination protein GerM
MDKNNRSAEQAHRGPEEPNVNKAVARRPERKKPGRLKLIITAVAFALLFAGGIGGGYVFFLKTSPKEPVLTVPQAPRQRVSETEIVVFFPSEGRLASETRETPKSPSRTAMAKATVEEFLKGPQGDIKSYVPKGARLLGIYDGADGILYVDISDSFRRNLQVDAISEYLLMRGLYESILANVYGVADVKVLIEGAEVESLGGHMSLERPLGETVAQTIVEE